MRFLFWLIRIMCLAGLIGNLTIVNIYNFWSGLITVLGLIAAVNIYVMGLLGHEASTKSLPSLFILMRFFQWVIILLTGSSVWLQVTIHSAWDALTFVLFIIDNRYDFIEKEDINTKAKTSVRRN